jgi:hypothetical protein
MILCKSCQNLPKSEEIYSFMCDSCKNARFAQGLKPFLCDVCAVGKKQCQYCKSSLSVSKDSAMEYLNSKYQSDIIYSKVKGSTMADGRQDNLSKLTSGQQLYFIHEKDNKFDSNAIKLFADKDLTVELGYVNKELSPDLLKFMYDHSIRFNIYVSEVTGGTGDKTSFGCNIMIKLHR